MPLVESVFRDGGFEDFVFDVGPDAALDDGHGRRLARGDAGWWKGGRVRE